MKLRPYQHDAVESVIEAFEQASSTLIVLPTGTGKTICFLHVAERMKAVGRIMILAHREELIWQAAKRYEHISGDAADIEMAEFRARRSIFNQSKVVVSSIQTQCAGRGTRRMANFDPNQFSLLIVDEAHHAPARSYRRVINHYKKNPYLKVLGVTATPDRHDEAALGQIFETVAYDYELPDAIRDGWLVPIEQHAVHVKGLDYSSVRTTAGDLNGADLARVMEYEESLHGIASPTIEITNGRRALLFAASLAHAERLCEIFNRHQPESARWVHGGTPKEERRQMIKDYAQGRFQILCNVGVATEGFDDPGIELIIMARPTKSRALYSQMAGRGTRTLSGTVDGIDDADERRLSIATSAKQLLEVVDFVGNAGRHKLVSTADILGGNYDDMVVLRAKKKAQEEGKAGHQVDMMEMLETAQRELEQEAERARRKELRFRASYSTSTVDPFDVLQVRPWKERGWDKGRQPSDKMIAFLERSGIPGRKLAFGQARQLIQEIISRREHKKATYKQARLLGKYGYATDMSFADAKKTIDAIAAAGWRRPEPIAEVRATWDDRLRANG